MQTGRLRDGRPLLRCASEQYCSHCSYILEIVGNRGETTPQLAKNRRNTHRPAVKT
jgi:hypothetical protein